MNKGDIIEVRVYYMCGHMVSVFKFIHTSTFAYGVDQGGPTMSWCIKRAIDSLVLHTTFI